MRLSHIDVCSAVLMTGSVSAAARLLNASQPAVTKLLQRAENEFGFKLFTRDKNRLVPTEEALALQTELFDISARIQHLRELTHTLTQEPGSVLRVDSVPSLAASLLPTVVKRLCEQFPRITCHLETHPHAAIVERLLRRQTDVGFALASMPHEGVVEETLARGQRVCVAPVGEFAATKRHVTWKDLSRCRLIRITGTTPSGAVMREAARQEEEAAPGGVTVTTNLLALKLAEDGVGVTTIDSFTASRADLGKVRVLPLSPEVPVEIRWMRRAEAKLSHPARRFVQILGAEAARLVGLHRT